MATWTKLTADWLVSLTAVAGSSAIVYCEVSRPADNGRRNSHRRVQKYLYCVSGCCGTHVITGARKTGSASVANWQNLGVDVY